MHMFLRLEERPSHLISKRGPGGRMPPAHALLSCTATMAVA